MNVYKAIKMHLAVNNGVTISELMKATKMKYEEVLEVLVRNRNLLKFTKGRGIRIEGFNEYSLHQAYRNMEWRNGRCYFIKKEALRNFIKLIDNQQIKHLEKEYRTELGTKVGVLATKKNIEYVESLGICHIDDVEVPIGYTMDYVFDNESKLRKLGLYHAVLP